MDTKEAIEFLENTIYLQKKSDDIITYKKYNNLINKVIECLKCGERFEMMWKKFKDKNGGLWGYGKGKYIRELMNEFEQKYFPKED